MVQNIETGTAGIQNLLAMMIQLNRDKKEADEARREREETRSAARADREEKKRLDDRNFSATERANKLNELKTLADLYEKAGNKKDAAATRKRIAEMMDVTVTGEKQASPTMFKGKTGEAENRLKIALRDPLGALGAAGKDFLSGGNEGLTAFYSPYQEEQLVNDLQPNQLPQGLSIEDTRALIAEVEGRNPLQGDQDAIRKALNAGGVATR